LQEVRAQLLQAQQELQEAVQAKEEKEGVIRQEVRCDHAGSHTLQMTCKQVPDIAAVMSVVEQLILEEPSTSMICPLYGFPWQVI
jgi:hypothetical protein